MQGLGAIFKEYGAFSVGETPRVHERDEILKTIAADRGELNMIFQFDIAQIDYGKLGRFYPGTYSFGDIKDILNYHQTLALEGGGWNAPYLENHDQPRAISRFASESPKYRIYSSKLMATFLLFQSGTPYVFQGQEIGMANIPKDWDISEYKDVATIGFWTKFLKTNPNEKEKEAALHEIWLKGRDNGRTPMHWDNSKHCGFTSNNVKPWMRVTSEFDPKCNVASQINDPASPFSYWSNALKIRKEYKEALVYGSFELLPSNEETTIVYARETLDGKLKAVSMSNFSEQKVHVNLAVEATRVSRVLLANYGDIECQGLSITLRPYEAALVLVE